MAKIVEFRYDQRTIKLKDGSHGFQQEFIKLGDKRWTPVSTCEWQEVISIYQLTTDKVLITMKDGCQEMIGNVHNIIYEPNVNPNQVERGNFELINPGSINTITSFLKVKSQWFKYYERKRFLWITIIKPGFHIDGFLSSQIVFTEEELTKNNPHLFVENKIAYHKPHIEMKLSNGTVKTKYFNTKEDLFKFMNRPEFSSINWIER